MEKRCNRCGETKPLSEFHKNKRTKDGLQGRCKPCHVASVMESIARHGDRERAYRVEWRRRTAETVKARIQRHIDKDPDAYRAKAAARQAEYRKRHPDRVKQALATYRAANPGKSNEHNHRARAQQVGTVSYRILIERDGDICYLCGLPIDPNAAPRTALARSFDHVVPLSKGGPHSMDNMRVAHYGCNLRKGARDR